MPEQSIDPVGSGLLKKYSGLLTAQALNNCMLLDIGMNYHPLKNKNFKS